MDVLNTEKKRPIEYLSDLELTASETEYDTIESQLSEAEEQLLQEILEIENGIEKRPSLMHDVLKAVEKGSLDYLNSMTDTGDTFNEMKNPSDVSRNDNIEIDKKNKPASSVSNWQTRTMKEAKINPFDHNTSESVKGMSAEGAKKFERYREAYTQRTKSITAISAGGTIVKSSDNSQNYESLSGLRGYRVGPVVPMPTVQEMKEKYQVEVNTGNGISPASFIRKENFAVFDQQLMKEFGFATRAQAEKWRKDNHLTIHEGPDGMFLVPTDVHDAVPHKGYCSKLADVLKGEDGAEEALKTFKSEATKQYIKHEAHNRGIRAMKGLGLSLIKDVIKHTIIIVCKETYQEFKQETDKSLWKRIKSIFHRCWISLKKKIKHMLSNIWDNIKGSFVAELLTALNDFLFGTFKNIFKLVRQMWGSIKSAFKIIRGQSTSWEDRIFEVTKVLSAGIVGIIGFSLNELIEKGLTSIGIPFASFVSECVSGLFAGILSALVLMLFDNMKKSYKAPSPYVQIMLANSQIICIDTAKINLSALKTDMMMKDTYEFVEQTFVNIAATRADILQEKEFATRLHEEIGTEIEETRSGKNRIRTLANTFINDDNF